MRTRYFCGVIVALACAAPPAPGQQPASAQFTHGQVTFTQDGREATWLLWQGTLHPVPGTEPSMLAAFLFTPDGKPGPEDGGSLFRLSFKKSRETYSLVAVAVENGPGGRDLASYDASKAKCKLTVAQFDEKKLGGAVACTGVFDGGPAVTRLYFSATP